MPNSGIVHVNDAFEIFSIHSEWVHTLCVSVKIELKMDQQGCKQLNIFINLALNRSVGLMRNLHSLNMVLTQ